MLRVTIILLVLTLAVYADHDRLKSKLRKALLRKQFQEGGLRLVDGPTESSGRVEIYHNGEWGTVCDDSWGDEDAIVVCRQLGYYSGGMSYKYAHFGEGSGEIWLDNVNCDGTESLLTSCIANSFGDHNCGHGEDAGVACASELPGSADGDIRLVGGDDESSGRVEIYHNDTWGTVCDDFWDDNDATVVCRQLGYTSGVGFQNANYGSGSGQIWLDNVECSGSESFLTACPANDFGDNNCGHTEDASVSCSGSSGGGSDTGVSEGDIRLSGGDSLSGRVEIYHSGEWGTVCDDFWEDADASVVCRQLGLSGGTAHKYAHFGEGSGQIWLDNVECSGNELTLSSCTANPFGDENCGHGEDAGVTCEDAVSGEESDLEGTIRLMDGVSELSGRVEIYHNGVWGTVCDDLWEDADASVVCRQLGLSGGTAHKYAHFGAGSGQIWLDNVECSGNELTLSSCTANPFGDENCGHGEDAGVTCGGAVESGETIESSDVEGDIRLMNGDSESSGRVEVYHNGIWGTVCDDLWEDVDASVVCQQLGYSGGTAHDAAHYGEGSGQIWLDNVECRGDELLLVACDANGWGYENCNHGEDASVTCV